MTSLVLRGSWSTYPVLLRKSSGSRVLKRVDRSKNLTGLERPAIDEVL